MEAREALLSPLVRSFSFVNFLDDFYGFCGANMFVLKKENGLGKNLPCRISGGNHIADINLCPTCPERGALVCISTP